MNDKRMAELSRTKHANMLMDEVASIGRKFFNHKGFISVLELSDSGRVFFHDSYTNKRIYTHQPKAARWKGFSNGGTLKTFIEMLRDYIKKDKKIPINYWDENWGEHYPNPWGYNPDDLEQLKFEAIRLGITADE